MNKIYGYTQEEAKSLIDYISEGKEEGKTLTFLFESFGKSHGRAKGSVRNYYYMLLKSRDDEKVRPLLKDCTLRAGEIKEFTEEETDKILTEIITEKSKGLSVRRAIRNVAGDDEKKVLRYQNKYRNVLKKQPERIRALSLSLGLSDESETERRMLLKRRIDREIDGAYAIINNSLRAENDRLKRENEYLRSRLDVFEKNPV